MALFLDEKKYKQNKKLKKKTEENIIHQMKIKCMTKNIIAVVSENYLILVILVNYKYDAEYK